MVHRMETRIRLTQNADSMLPYMTPPVFLDWCMGCVNTRTRTFYSFPYQNSEEGLSTNNLSSTTVGFSMSAHDHQVACGDHKVENTSPRKGAKYNIDQSVHMGKHHQGKNFGRIGSLSKIASSQESRTISFLDTSKRRGLFYRSKSDDQKQFVQVVNFLDSGNGDSSKYKRHHRSENQLPMTENSGEIKGKLYAARRQSDL